MSGRSLTTHQPKTTCDNALGFRSANLSEEGGRLDQILETVNYRKTPVGRVGLRKPAILSDRGPLLRSFLNCRASSFV